MPNLDDYKIILEANPSVDQRTFNKPTVSQVGGVWLETSDCEQIMSKHIEEYGKNGKTQIVKHYYGYYDSLQYPLIFANGEPAWHPGIERIMQNDDPSCEQRTCQGEQVLFSGSAALTADDVIHAENEGNLILKSSCVILL